MNLLKKKESPYFNIALTALLCALNVIFVFITRFLPLSFFTFMFILPSISTIEGVLCKRIYFIPYILISGALCFLVNIAEISNTIFYIVPSLIIGYVIGFLLTKRANISIIFVISSLVQLTLTYITLPIIKLIYEIDIVNVFVNAFNLNEFKYINDIVPTFIFFMSSAQVGIALLFSAKLVKTLQIPIIFEHSVKNYVNIFVILLCALSIGMIFIDPLKPLVLLLFSLALMITIFETLIIKPSNTFGVILVVVSFIISLFIFLIFSTQIIKPFQIILFEIMILSVNFYIMYFKYKETQK